MNQSYSSSSSSFSTPPDKDETEKTAIIYGEEAVLHRVMQFASTANLEISACVDQSRPLLAIEILSLRKAFMESKKRGVRLHYVTEITNDNLSYCKKLMKFVSELRHLGGIKGNFYVSDSEFIAPASFHEKGRVASQVIYSNVKEIIGHQRYVFDTLWAKAIPAEQKIREIEEEGSEAYATSENLYQSRLIEDPDEIIREIGRYASESNRLCTCISSDGLYYSYSNFFELKKKLVEKHKSGGHEGVRYVTNINKENMELVRLYLDAGIQIRHVKNLPPMSFGVSDKEAAATIEKMHIGDKVQRLLISNDPLYVTHFTSIFEELWDNSVDALERIRNIEEGGDLTNIEILDNPRESLKLAADMVKSAKEEVLRIYPSMNAFRRQVKLGALDLFKEIIDRNVRVRIMIPFEENDLESIVNHIDKDKEDKDKEALMPILDKLNIRSVDKSLETHIGIIVVDRKQSLIIESKDDSKDNYYEAAGLAAYSNSRQIAVSYASIFENLWKQSEMYEESRIYNRMQKEFINVAAHELRTPVQPIIGLADDLYRTVQDNKQRKELEVIFRNAKRLQRLVEDILDVTKIESDSLNLRKEQFNLEEAVHDALNDIKNSKEFQHIRKANVNIKFDSRPTPTTTTTTTRAGHRPSYLVNADKGRIYQVISNLLSNAVKFTQDGAVSVSIDSDYRDKDEEIDGGHIGRRDKQAGKVIIVLVKDTGIGIHPDIFSRLFTKFASKSFEGTGLGLFISKKIIEAHGGKIWGKNNNDNENEKGATFGFSLPLVE